MAYIPVAQDTSWQRSDEVDLAHCAVLVIDELGGSNGVLPVLEEMVTNSVAIVNAARKANVPVIFANDAHIPGLDREFELWGPHGIVDTEDAQPLEAFAVCECDYIIPKRRYDAFFETDLDLTLRELGVDTLIVVGADTNICVLQTLAGAYFRCYKTIVVSDATATFLIGTQEWGLEYFTRCYDSRVVDTACVLNYLNA